MKHASELRMPPHLHRPRLRMRFHLRLLPLPRNGLTPMSDITRYEIAFTADAIVTHAPKEEEES